MGQGWTIWNRVQGFLRDKRQRATVSLIDHMLMYMSRTSVMVLLSIPCVALPRSTFKVLKINRQRHVYTTNLQVLRSADDFEVHSAKAYRPSPNEYILKSRSKTKNIMKCISTFFLIALTYSVR